MKLIQLIANFLLVLTITHVVPLHASPQSATIHPFRIADNLYYVGNNYAASYLITTAQGNILINSNYQADVPTIQSNIERLGFKLSNIKILLISHAHADHGGGSALIKAKTGAKYMVMAADVPVVESGGKADFQYGNSKDPENFYPPTKVDRVLHDGDQVKLGNIVLVAHHTGGHTKGCTTWTMNVAEHGKTYHAVIVGGPYVTPNTKLVHNAAYPAIANDFQHMFKVLKSLPCDIFLGAHGMYFNLEKKYALLNKGKVNPFIDSDGYKKFITQKEHDFSLALAKQKAAE